MYTTRLNEDGSTSVLDQRGKVFSTVLGHRNARVQQDSDGNEVLVTWPRDQWEGSPPDVGVYVLPSEEEIGVFLRHGRLHFLAEAVQRQPVYLLQIALEAPLREGF